MRWLHYPSRAKPLVMAIVTVLAVQTIMAIMTLLAIETDILGYRDRTGYRNRHSSFRNCTGYQLQGTRSRVASGAPSTLVSSTRGPSRLSLVFCVAVLPWLGTFYRVVSLLKQVRRLRSLRAVLATLGAWTPAAGVESFRGHHLPCPLSSSHVCTFFGSRLVSRSLIWDSR